MTHPLDNPVLRSLTGPHARLARTRGRAARYPADISPFCALPGEPDAADWADATRLVSPGERVLSPAPAARLSGLTESSWGPGETRTRSG